MNLARHYLKCEFRNSNEKIPLLWEKVNQGNTESGARVRLEFVPDAVSRSEAGANDYLKEDVSPSTTGWWA